MRSELFLQKYRVLENLLEKRYEGKKVSSSSVVIEYIRDADSEPVRVDLDLMREIRNILSHNAGTSGAPVVEPSQETVDRLEEIISYVRRPRLACEFGTPAKDIFSAHMNDRVIHVMRNMQKNGYSHVPVEERGGIVAVFSVKSLFDYMAENGPDSVNSETKIAALGEKIRLDRLAGDRYMFVPEDASIVSVRNAFEKFTRKNSRLSAVFVTKTGAPEEPLLCMLTPWDVLSDESPSIKETAEHGNGKR
ncbi:MAG: CBS domain-containing protein [Clostridia bacterium]|nr:CBS domain-containing protein [Clostridia bacterium]